MYVPGMDVLGCIAAGQGMTTRIGDGPRFRADELLKPLIELIHLVQQ